MTFTEFPNSSDGHTMYSTNLKHTFDTGENAQAFAGGGDYASRLLIAERERDSMTSRAAREGNQTCALRTNAKGREQLETKVHRRVCDAIMW